MTPQEKINQFRSNQEEQAKSQALSDEARQNTEMVAGAVNHNTESVTQATDKVASEVSKSSQAIIKNLPNNDGVTEALNNLVVATVMSRDPELVKVVQTFTTLLDNLSKASNKLDKNPLNELPAVNKQLAKALNDFVSKPDKKDVDYTESFDRLQSAIEKLDIKPTVNLPETNVSVDLQPLQKLLGDIKQAVKDSKVEVPETDLTGVEAGLQAVQDTIANLSFPVPNYVLPFVSQTGKAVQVKLNDDGTLPVTTSVSTGSLATSANQTNASQKTQVVDGSGNVIGATSNALDVNIKSGSASGTQYTEDAAAAADPVGTAVNLVRKDTPSATVSTDGDNIAQRGSNFGAAYVTLLDTSGNAVTVGGGTQYAEDSASSDGEQVMMAGVVRKDTRGAISGTDGDRTELQTNASGDLRVDGSAVTQPVSGTITANAGTGSFTVVNGGTFAVQAAQSGTWNVTNVSGTVSLPTGASTLAEQQTQTTSLQLIDNIVLTEDLASQSGDSGVMALAVRASSPANTSGTNGDYEPLQVNAGRLWVSALVDTALPAGTNVIGHVIADTGSTTAVTGNVTVVQSTATNLKVDASGVAVPITDNSGSITVDNGGTFAVQATVAAGATAIAKAEDVASADADVGVPAMAIRKATPANTSGTDGDYEMLQVSAGRLWVDASGKTLTVDGSGVTQPVSGTVSITSNSAVNVAQINGVTPLMGNGLTGTGSQRVTIASDNTAFAVNSTLSAETTKVIGVTRTSDGAGNLLTSNSTTYTAKFGLDANMLGTLGTAFSTAGKVDVKGADGDVFVRQTTGSNLHTVLDSGTLTTLTTLTGITNTVVTDDLAAAATGSAVPANAHYQGLNAQTALPAAASAGNLTGETGDKFGRQVVLPNAVRDIMGTQTTTITASTSETTIITAAASTFNDLVSVFISNTSATAARVDLRDTTAGSVIFQFYIPAGDMRGVSLTTPWPQTTVNTNWTATSSTSVTDLRISTLYIKNK